MKLTRPAFNRLSRIAFLTGTAAIALSLTGCAGFNPVFNPDFHPAAGLPSSANSAGLPADLGGIILPGQLPGDFPTADVPIESGQMLGGIVQTNGTPEKDWLFDVSVNGTVDDAIATAKSDFAHAGYDFEDVGSQVKTWEHRDTFYYDPNAHAIGLKFTKDGFMVFVTVSADLQGGTLVGYVVERSPA
ncbi:hypothetical protein [Subtercola endophyticus]|uniref:hypothetical protein n=1 Tax=Subtercola endophyticus TaxID=2895559 RepID=UPI001E3BEB00|nr:hypothetical protein [Subtercola endophyticus]UFS59898.1 hypothetical protein LQ955_03660 [Subtercola endophyticus]